MKKVFLAFLFLLSMAAQTFAQTDPTLFTVNGKPVTVSEFNYIYAKTNGTKADFSRGTIMEYLDLYTKFKMKVARAKEMQLDTVPALKEELLGYRRQLADSYLTDREVTDKLVKDVYERMHKDVKLSHILVSIADKDTSKSYAKIQSILARLKKGDAFAEVAKEVSEDKNSNTVGGNIGYITAMLPDGFFAFENAMYTTPLNGMSDIVRSPLGYHILKVTDIRTARGEIEVSHILIRKKKEGVEQPNAQARIDSIYNVLSKGGSFDDLAERHSEDGNSSNKKGYLGFFGIGRYELPFEDAGFGIEKNGNYSKPVETSVGWHIIKRLSHRDIEAYDVVKNRLKARIQRDQRYELARTSMIERIKKESNFKEEVAAKEKFIAPLDSSFLTYSWVRAAGMPEKLMTFGNNTPLTTADFADWLVENANKRIGYSTQFNNNVSEAARQLIKDYANEKALAYEETQLDTKYPDFRNLMREYEEGILLFEAIKQNVWDKASTDTIGLDKFYNNNKDRYVWEERASLVYYTVNDTLKGDFEKIKKYIAKHNPQDVLKKYNKKGEYVKFRQETLERGKGKVIDQSVLKAGNVVAINAPETFLKVDKIIAKTRKSLKESRGYVVADYQDFLEKQWMEDLSKRYKVEVNQNVLNSLIKK